MRRSRLTIGSSCCVKRYQKVPPLFRGKSKKQWLDILCLYLRRNASDTALDACPMRTLCIFKKAVGVLYVFGHHTDIAPMQPSSAKIGAAIALKDKAPVWPTSRLAKPVPLARSIS